MGKIMVKKIESAQDSAPSVPEAADSADIIADIIIKEADVNAEHTDIYENTVSAKADMVVETETDTAEKTKKEKKRTGRKSLYVTKKSLATSMILTAALILGVLFYRDRYLEAESGTLLFALSLAGALLAGVLAAVRTEVSDKTAKIVSPIIYFLMPVASMCMAECINGKFIYDFSPQSFFCNYIVYLMLYSAVMIFSGSWKMPVILMTPVIYICSIAFSVVLAFRGTPIVPMDILAISTALGVASNYVFTVPHTLVLGTILFVIIMLIGIRMTRVKFSRRGSLTCRVLSLLFILGVTIPFYATDIAANHGVKPDFWDQRRGYYNSGTFLNFFLNTKYLFVEKPDDYNSSQITAIVTDFIEENPEDEGIFASAQEMQEREAALLQKETETALNDTDTPADTDTAAGADINPALPAAPEQETDLPDLTDDSLAALQDASPEDIAEFITKRNILLGITDDMEDGYDENGNPLPNTGKDTELAVRCTSEEGQPAAKARKKKDQAPNIICIMNETYADLRVLGELSTNMDYMPFTRSLTKNTIKGNLYMPVIGAGTSNSEFEFLTGNTMAFLTAGSNAYELYVKNHLPSLAYTLEAQNYSRSALHVYYRNSWQRDINYPLLGFERFDSIESFIDNDALDEYRNGNQSFYCFQEAVNAQYPDENVLLRRFVSDSFDYKLLTEMYETRDQSKPFFVFNVTMQNHGGYNSGYTNFKEKIRLTSTEEYYPLANRYLSLIYESDQAFKDLVTYFSKVKEPTIICMFGDHQPNIETEFTESLLGSEISDLTLEQRQQRYATPFIIWANYDIEEGYIDKISSNYLSTLLLQTAELETAVYNDYLSALYRILPVIDSTGYITADGRHYSYDQKTEFSVLLEEYEKIQYNNLFDSIGRHNDLFYIRKQQ